MLILTELTIGRYLLSTPIVMVIIYCFITIIAVIYCFYYCCCYYCCNFIVVPGLLHNLLDVVMTVPPAEKPGGASAKAADILHH